MRPLLLSQGPPDLAGGRYAAPAWIILSLGAAVVAGAAVFLVLRLRRTGRVSRTGAPKDKR